jgi:hypothetical protein
MERSHYIWQLIFLVVHYRLIIQYKFPYMRLHMKHFPDRVWASFVRGRGQEYTNRQIEAHIANGCPDCVATVGMWQQMYSIGINESTREVLHASISPLDLPSSTGSSETPWTLGRLVFDSLAQPPAGGIRSGVSDSRQLVFDAEGTIVDLILNSKPQSPTVSLVGQVIDKEKELSGSVSVILWTESEELLAKTSANEFGEFQMEFAPQERLRLSIEIAGSKPIRIPPVNLNPSFGRTGSTSSERYHYPN